jgi:phosphoglycolate phosphatase-like HAD superfamily hydrolase
MALGAPLGSDRDHDPVGVTEAIAFDLDMTLVDSRPVSRHALERMAFEHRVDLDIDALMMVYGLPLSQWLPSDVEHSRFRLLQSQELSRAVAMPGAMVALEAVRRASIDIVVVTASPAEISAGMLQAAGLYADRVWADVWGDGKVEPLLEERCRVFVGDHAEDMSAALQAGAIAIGVHTGTSRPLGAEVELENLTRFPAWLADHRAEIH